MNRGLISLGVTMKKNILIVTSSLHIGGAERVIANLAKHLDKDRFSVTVCHLLERGVIGDEIQAMGIPIVGVNRRNDPVRRYLSFLELRRVIRKHQIDLVHSHTTYSLCDSSLCRLTTTGIKTVHTFHRGNYPDFDPRYMRLEKFFSRFCDQLVAVGVEQGKKICNTYRFPQARLSTILNGVEDKTPEIDQQWSERLKNDGRLIIGSISTLIEQKGIPYLLEAARKVVGTGAGVLFVIIGEGHLRPQLEEQCRALGLQDSVIFTGWIPSAASRVMPLFDVFIQSSLWEAMSMVVLEAMAASRAVIVTDVGDNRHVVEQDRSGLIVEPKDSNALAEAMLRLINSETLRRELGAAARERFQAQYTARAMAEKYEDLYSRLLA